MEVQSFSSSQTRVNTGNAHAPSKPSTSAKCLVCSASILAKRTSACFYGTVCSPSQAKPSQAACLWNTSVHTSSMVKIRQTAAELLRFQDFKLMAAAFSEFIVSHLLIFKNIVISSTSIPVRVHNFIEISQAITETLQKRRF